MKKKILIVEDEFIVANDLSTILTNAGYEISGIADSYEESMQIISDNSTDMALLDIHLKGKLTGIDLARKLQRLNIPFVYLSANSNKTIMDEVKTTKPYGFLVKPFREKDVLISLEIASYHHEHSKNYHSLLEVNLSNSLNEISTEEQNCKDVLLKLTKAYQPHFPFDLLQITSSTDLELFEPIGFSRIGLNEYQFMSMEELSSITGKTLNSLKHLYQISESETISEIQEKPQFESSLLKNPFKKLIVTTFNLNSYMVHQVKLNDAILNFNFFSRHENVFDNNLLKVLTNVEPIISKILNPCFRTQKNVEKIVEIEESVPNIETDYVPEIFENMIGKSLLLLTVFDHIRKVAPMETSILITGESGTGKELVAQSIHQLSKRKNKPFVTINCGTLPENLIESILFGHEKGAFTGATEKRIGKFEQANSGTIFLDEIGEMPLDLQVKLLRVLQEKEIEKIGGAKPIKLDVRIIAATNKLLEEEIEAGRFRLDLYYRLNVFPIHMPPLRERKEDIPLLVSHFLKTKNAIFPNGPKEIEPHVLSSLIDYHWPGNVRELEHYIEKSILLSNGDTIKDVYLSFSKNQDAIASKTSNQVKTIDELEREYILFVLRKCKGKVFGGGGAAELLKIPPSTLNSKIRKLGIKKEDIYS